MRLVENHVNPALPPKDVLIGQDDLVGSDTHLPGVLGMPPDSLLFPLLLVPVIGQDLHAGKKLLELHLPVEDNRCRNDDEVLTPYAFVASEMTEKGDGLDSLAKEGVSEVDSE